MRFRTVLWLAAWFSTGTQAEAVLSSGATRITAGSEVELTLTLTNGSGAPVMTTVEEELHVQVQTATALTTLHFAADRSGPIEVAPGEFTQIKLRGTVPKEISGAVTLSPTGIPTNSILLQVDEAPAEVAAARTDSKENALKGEGVLFDKPPPLAISAYEPTYIVIGGDGGLNAKFQISLRYRLFDNNGPLARRLPWIDDLYLSYSQTSLWDLSEASKPFKDSSYRPRVFYANYDLKRVLDGRLRLGFESGFGHESNGKEGVDSRSFNMLYVRPMIMFGDPDGFRAYFAPLVHNYIADSENEDIGDYRGNVDWLIGAGSKGGLDFSATLRKGNRSTYGSIELDARYPLAKLSGGDLTGWIMLQYFDGWGESLIDYNRKAGAQFRLGIVVAQ